MSTNTSSEYDPVRDEELTAQLRELEAYVTNNQLGQLVVTNGKHHEQIEALLSAKGVRREDFFLKDLTANRQRLAA